ncbi:MAG: hypothetical protein LQ350_002667 [Teloschistes chrysophthalmus]|nr:MAG: hypothetical protein LQ350_002667 [Niorma chrysophthalma]
MSATHPPDNSLAWKVWVGSIVSVALATLFVGLRLYARRISAAPYWWDDYTIIAALVVQWGMGISRWIPLAEYYYGHHTIYVGPHRLEEFRKAFVGIQTLYFLNATLTKISLLLLYHRIFGVVKRFRLALWLGAFLVVAWWIATTILGFLGCTPFAYNWNKKIDGQCVDLVMFFRWNGICNLLLDFLILLLPLPMVWRLSITARQKTEISGMFLLGLFVCVAGILRVLAYHPTQLADSTYSGVGSMTWSIVEQGIGVVCACLPTLRPLMGSISPSRSKENTKNNSGIGMDNFRGGTIRSEVGNSGRSAWKPGAYDSESTVGFARLQDDEQPLSAADVQRSVYNPTGNSVTTSGHYENKNGRATIHDGILKEQTIDQTSEIVR